MKIRVALGILAAAFSVSQASAAPPIDCKMHFDLTGWSLFYKEASGSGTVKCSNGESMRVTIKARGGGLTAGKTEIHDGIGSFSDVYRISDVLGSYAEGGAEAAAGRSAKAQVMVKGNVSLALAGKGEGIALGVSFGKFTISRAGK